MRSSSKVELCTAPLASPAGHILINFARIAMIDCPHYIGENKSKMLPVTLANSRPSKVAMSRARLTTPWQCT